MIYFDTEHEAYAQLETIEKWHKTYLTECTEEEYKDLQAGKLMWENDQIIINPDYEKEQEEKEKERIGNLKCTKRVFALMLQELGITYSQLKELIASNEQAQLEWELASTLLRSNPLLDIFGEKLGISSKQIDLLFKYANGEITIDEFKTKRDIQEI